MIEKDLGKHNELEQEVIKRLQNNRLRFEKIKEVYAINPTETVVVTRLAYNHSWMAFFLHRSGETVDSFITDLIMPLDTGHLKTRAPAQGYRMEKCYRLLCIEQLLGAISNYSSTAFYIHKPQRKTP